MPADGLGLPDLKSNAAFQYVSSKKVTALHVDSISAQDQILMHRDSQGNDLGDATSHLHDLLSTVRTDKKEALEEKCAVVASKLDAGLLTIHNQNNDKGASHWLNALPLQDQGFNLTKQEFRDAMRLRYCIPLSALPSLCVCGDQFNEVHALSCKKGGFINQRHDNVRNLFTSLLNKVCTNVGSEPHLTPLSGEHLRFRTANRKMMPVLISKHVGFGEEDKMHILT